MAKKAVAGARTKPSGGRFYERRSEAVSGAFIKSLKGDGISQATIRAIEQDNEGRESTRSPVEASAEDDNDLDHATASRGGTGRPVADSRAR
jgi:hypothetical protein